MAQNETAETFLPLDIRRLVDHIEVQASVPGYKPDDVNVTVDGGVITISAERHEESPDQDGFLRRERYVGRLFRQVVLGDGVDGDRATASFEDGVLTVKVPMIARPEPKRIPIQSSAGKSGRIVTGEAKE